MPLRRPRSFLSPVEWLLLAPVTAASVVLEVLLVRLADPATLVGAVLLPISATYAWVTVSRAARSVDEGGPTGPAM